MAARTKASKVMKWCFTHNKYTNVEWEKFKQLDNNPDVKWGVCGKEIGDENGTPHLQGYLYFGSQKSLNAVKLIFGTVTHWEPAVGTHEQNFTYCTKEGTWLEVGSRPVFEDNGTREKKRWKRTAELARQGNFALILEEEPQIYLCHYKGIEAIFNKFADKPAPLTPSKELPVRFHWYYGPGGTGKSRTAFARFPPEDTFNKPLNKWWDGYESQQHVVIDDLSIKDDYMGHFLKTWCDYQPVGVEVKMGNKQIRPQYVSITSNWHPAEIWTDPKMIEPIMRRFGIFYKGPAGGEFKGVVPGAVSHFVHPLCTNTAAITLSKALTRAEIQGTQDLELDAYDKAYVRPTETFVEGVGWVPNPVETPDITICVDAKFDAAEE